MSTVTEPIVGRDGELASLARALDGVAAGEPQLVEITGEAGIGKTRLLDELCARAEQADCLVLRGAAAEFERNVPFAPVVDALDAHLSTLPLERLGIGAGDARSQLEAIFPALGADRSAARGVHEERYRSYRAVRELLEALARARPLILALDDLHWADDASIELIGALVHRPPAAAVVLALAGRANQLPDAIEAAIGAAERRGAAACIRLGPLSADAAARMLDGRVPEAQRHEVFAAAGGNPFYMEQLARVAGARPAERGGDGLGLPPAVASALAQEIGALPENVALLLRAAAVAGERFEPDLVAEVAEVEEAAALDALDELLDRELVRPTEVPRRFAFRHQLVWRAVYEGTKGGWRLAAHRRAAEALAARGAPAAERAHHVEHAARRGDEDAVAVLADAGRSIAASAPATAARWFRAALRLLPDGPEHEDARRSLLVELASALRGSGDLDGCRDALRDALDLVTPDETAERARLEADCAMVETWLGRAHDAHRRLVRARADLQDERSPEAVLLDVRLALDAMDRLEFDRGVEIGTGALAVARELDDRALVAEAAAAVALGHGLAGSLTEARAHHDIAVAAVEQLSERALGERVEIFFYLAFSEIYIEEFERAIATAERGITVSRLTGQGHLLVPLMLARPLPLDTLGRLTESIAAGEEALAAARTSPNPQYLFWALWECAYSYALAGDVERSLALFEQSVEAAKGRSHNFLSWPQPWSTYSLALRLDGRREESLEMALEALGGPEAPRIAAFERLIAFEQIAEGMTELERLDEAAEFVARGEALAQRLGLVFGDALMAQARATLELARGDATAALRAVTAVREWAAAAGLRLDAAHLRRLEGMALAALGERDAAVAALREAERDFTEFPSVRARDAVRRELRRLGARMEPRGAAPSEEAGLAALSSREREIADLVADRRTNREIAATLFLSEKTVESHLRNIFRKLPAASRVEVARAVERERRGS
ncbi:MAG TPA: AAA family ATPase [Solirubrobacteraceae bacterium]